MTPPIDLRAKISAACGIPVSALSRTVGYSAKNGYCYRLHCLDVGANVIVTENALRYPDGFKLYQISFLKATVTDAAQMEENSANTRRPCPPGEEASEILDGVPPAFINGYIGITGRATNLRWKEHYALATGGGGHALHAAWRSILPLENPLWPFFLVLDSYKTLPEAYAAEEKLVADHSLAPKGLNVIPGGYAGIRLLHQLGYTNKKKLGPEERERILSDIERAGPSPHYRIGHWRTYSHERYTTARGTRDWIPACFVLGKEIDADLPR